MTHPDFDIETVGALLCLVALGAAYVCRLDGLSWRTSRPGTVAFHLAGLAYIGGCLFAVLGGHDLGFEWAGLVFAGLWLVESWPTWKHGPPAHVMTGPAPFSDTAQVSSGAEPIYVLGDHKPDSRWLQ